MKLHLPKQLFTALLAAITLATPATLTLGSAAWGEEAEASTTTTWAGPGYMWIGDGGDVFANVTTADAANEIWKNSSNWQTVESSYVSDSGNGPGTPNSNMWETIKIDGSTYETGVTFGSEEKRLITFEGWNPRFELSNNVKLYASMTKWQAATALTTSVTNGSTLDIDFGGGYFLDMWGGTSSLTIGESSSIIFRLQQTDSKASFTINLQDASSTMEFIGKSAITHTGAITVSSTYIAEAIKGASDSFGRIDLGLYANNVDLSKLSFDFGLDDTWLATDVEITSDNAADYGNYYNIGKSAETGRYYITYSRRDANYTPLVYSGGTLAWNGEATFDSGRTFNANDDVTFQTADADVRLGMNVDAKVVTIEDGVSLSLTGGDYTLSSDILNLRGGTLKLNDNAIAEGALKLKDGSTGTLSLGNDVALDIVDTPTGIDLSVQMGNGSELNINPTSSSLSVQMGSGSALNINSISTNDTFATDDGVTDSTVTLQSGYSRIQNQFASYKGNLVVSNGAVVYIGADKDTNGADTANFNVGRVVIESGGAVHTHTTQYEITSDWDLRSGSTLGNKDNSKKLSGDIRFNIQEDGTYNANGTVTLMQQWHKTWEFSGLLSGQGNVELHSASLEDGEAVYKLSGATNDFTGTYILKDGENAASAREVVLQLANATAAQYATVKLSSTDSLAVLQLNQDATIKGLYSVDVDNKVTTNAAATLTVSEGDFAGKLENGSAANILSLKKSGTGTLNISGTAGTSEARLGGITVTEGCLNLQGTTYVNEVTVGGGELTFGGTNVTHNATSLKVYGGTVNINNSSTTLETISFDSSNGTTGGTTGGTVEFTKAEGQESATYTVSTIKSVNADGYTRNLTVGEGVTLEATSFTNNWGMGTITINGALDITGELKFWTGSNSSTENNILTGSGTVTAGSLTIGNWGKYNFSTVNLTVEGETSMTGATLQITSGTFNYNGKWNGTGGTVNLMGGTINFNYAENPDTASEEINTFYVLDIAGADESTAQINLADNVKLKVSSNMWLGGSAVINLAEGAELQKGTMAIIGTGNKSTVTDLDTGDSNAFAHDSDDHIVSNASIRMSQDSAAILALKLDKTAVTNTGSGELTVSNSANTITALSAENGNVKLSASMAVDSISAKSGKMVTVTNGNTIAMGGGAVSIGANGANATLTARSDTALAQLAQDASFTIADMTLSQVKLSAAQGTTVALNNLSGSAELAGEGHFSISGGEAQYKLAMSPVQAQVAAAENEKGSALTLSYASSTAITLNRNREGSNPTLALSVDPTLDVNGVFGAYDVTLTLNNFGISGTDLGESGDLTALSNAGITFTGWLGDALSNQTTDTALAEAVEDAPAAPTAPTVSYTYTPVTEGSNVGTLVITINGLNVPEPASATLGLAALMMLCARRRRKA